MLYDAADVRAMTVLIFHHIGEEMSEEVARQVVTASEQINMLEYASALEQLTQVGLIAVRMEGEMAWYSLSKEGGNVAQEIFDYFPASTRDEALRLSLRFYETLMTGIEYSAELVQADGGFYVEFRMKLHHKLCMVTKAFFDDEREAMAVQKRCELHPQTIENRIMAALTGEMDYLL